MIILESFAPFFRSLSTGFQGHNCRISHQRISHISGTVISITFFADIYVTHSALAAKLPRILCEQGDQHLRARVKIAASAIWAFLFNTTTLHLPYIQRGENHYCFVKNYTLKILQHYDINFTLIFEAVYSNGVGLHPLIIFTPVIYNEIKSF